MLKVFKKKLNLTAIVNPFYIYSISFLMAIIVYMWGWSRIFPHLSASLIIFLVSSFVLFLSTGYYFEKKEFVSHRFGSINYFFSDLMFWVIIILGLINVLYMRYIPFFDRTHNYRNFGMPVIDPLFNTLSIFFSVSFLQTYLNNKKKRFLLYIIIITIIQFLLFRRSTLVWIFVSSGFLVLLFYRRVYIMAILAVIITIPVLSYGFGLIGNIRSNLTRSQVLNDLGASSEFIQSGISHNHYITYLYLSSPLANLQENINKKSDILNNSDLKKFCFYCLVPGSITKRLEPKLKLIKPECNLINKDLIVGTFFMLSFYTMGWFGMLIMLVFLLAFLVLGIIIIKRWNTFNITTFSLFTATSSLLIFTNFLNRLDIILLLFVYPIIFHFIIKIAGDKPVSDAIKL
jgi:hypothetical protein